MRLLLDTHALISWLIDNGRLSERSKAAIRDPSNELGFSAAGAWEIAIQVQLGKIRLPGPPVTYIQQELERNAISTLSITTTHALHVYTLPMIHRDPFDRILIAQS